MTTLLEIRDTIIKFVGKYEAFVTPVCKFLAALSAILIIDGRIGYESTLASPLLAVIFALFCALIPMNITAILLLLYILVQLYSLALEAAAVGLVLVLIVFLMYFRYSPKDSVLLVLTPLCSAMGIPYLLPLTAGLLFGPASAVTVAIGTVLTAFIRFVSENETTIGQKAEELEMLTKFRYLIDGVIRNRSMMIMALAFALAVLVVTVIRRLRIMHAWSIAVAVGSLVQLLVLLVGDVRENTNLSIGAVFLGVIFSALIAEIIVFFLFNLDYARTEDVQFEDDDYYYYVKAVPKVTMSAPARRVKKISSSGGFGRKGGRRGARQEAEEPAEPDFYQEDYTEEFYGDEDLPDEYNMYDS